MAEYIEREDAIQFVQKNMTEVNRRKTEGVTGSIISEVYEMAIKHATDYLRIFPAADVVETRNCTQCKHFHKNAEQYPCSHCRNCYTDKFEIEAGV